MHYERYRSVTPKASLLLLEEDASKRAISRNSSVGCSSRIHYYYRRPEGIPFKWEMHPGTPKDPPAEEIIPPISPPPAMLSLRLPQPSITFEESKPSFFPKLKLWKHSHCRKYISRWRNKIIITRRKNDNNDDEYTVRDDEADLHGGSERFINLEICSSSSSCSSSFSFPENNSSKDRSLTMASRYGFQGCTPWNSETLGRFFVRVPRK